MFTHVGSIGIVVTNEINTSFSNLLQTCSKSFSTNPLDVKAGAPNLKPPGVIALLSPGQVFLFTEIEVLLQT